MKVICAVPSKLEIKTRQTWLLSPGSHHLNVVAYNKRG